MTESLCLITSPISHRHQIESRFSVQLSGLENGSPSNSPTHCGGAFVLDRLDVLSEMDGVLSESVVLFFNKKAVPPAHPWIFPGQSIVLTNGLMPFIECPEVAVFRDINISANSQTFARTFLGINSDIDLLAFDRCQFVGQSKAISTPSVVRKVNTFKIRNCQFIETKNRVFDCDNVSIDSLQITDNGLANIHSAAFFFPEICQTATSKATIERNNSINSPEHIAIPNGSYCIVGLVAMSHIEASDNLTEGLKTAKATADTGSWEFRANHLIERRNKTINCGHTVANPTGSRRVLNCKSGSGFSLPNGENITGIWDECEWTIEKSYFDALSLPVPQIEIGDANYRDCELRGCRINVSRLMPLSANSRFVPSFKITHGTEIKADVFVAEQNTYRGLFWFEHRVETLTGQFVFENSIIELTAIEGAMANDCLIRFNRLLPGSIVFFSNFTFITPELDNLFYLLDAAQNSEWTFEDSKFLTAINNQTWGANRPPFTVIGL